MVGFHYTNVVVEMVLGGENGETSSSESDVGVKVVVMLHAKQVMEAVF